MIDPIGIKPGALQAGRFEPQQAARVVPIAAARTPQPAATLEAGAREAAKAMAAKPPVDQERVQQIKRAIQEGRYPIVPAKIVDGLIAAQYLWAKKNDAE